MHHAPDPETPRDNPGYETRDLAIKPIIYFVIGLLLFGTTVQYVMRTVMTVVYFPQTNQAQVPRFADVMRDTNNSTQPELQRDTTKDMLDMYAQEDAVLTSYGKDKGGSNRIPLDRAMEIVAKKGLPVRPNAPEKPDALKYRTKADPYQATR